ncbi:MAG: sensor histidine kinase [Solirubrobacteraceae bacterium]
MEVAETHEYRHEALFYEGAEAFMEGVVPFVDDAVQAEEPILVVLSAAKIDHLREALGDTAEPVLFADMAEIGTNPARIIPAWQEFLSENAASGRRMRGIGEPIWAERSPAEMVECERHEALLNVAFGDPAFWLLCPYDTGALAPEVIEEAQRNHPHLTAAGAAGDSTRFPGNDALAAPFDRPLPEPPADALTVAIERRSLGQIRAVVAGFAYAAGMAEHAVADLVLAVDELAGNSILHAGGSGTLLLWREGDAVICEVRDGGRIDLPLAGRVEPPRFTEGGRGLWIANQLCELVQIRSFADGGAVRVHKRVR